MSLTIDINKVKSRTLVCEKYIDVDSYGYLEFKGSLLHAINNENISKDDALLICLELMHLINNENLNYETIKPKFKQLIQTVKRYNNIKNQYLKDKLFNKDYSIEKGILLEYIDNLPVRHNSFEDKPSKNKLNEIKSCLIDLDFDDLCYILGINPELTFEKDKILKKRIANEFIKYPVDLKKLENSSAKEIKNYLALLKDHNYGDYTNNLISDIHVCIISAD